MLSRRGVYEARFDYVNFFQYNFSYGLRGSPKREPDSTTKVSVSFYGWDHGRHNLQGLTTVRQYLTEHLRNAQNVEGLWSIVKRGIYGVYRVVSKKIPAGIY